MFFRRRRIPNTPYAEMSLLDLIKSFIISKLPQQKKKVADEISPNTQKIPQNEITYIAIVLDGVVEDVMRAQNRLAALLLSKPEFVEFDPSVDRPQIGETEFFDGKFQYPKTELMTDEEIANTLKKMQKGDNDEK